jgi:nitrilase
MTRTGTMRVAAVQGCPVLLDREATLDLVDELTHEAAAQGANLVAFPEAFVPGPPVWIDALPVGDHTDWHAQSMRESLTVPGSGCDRLAATARGAHVTLLVGIDERDQDGGTVDNTVLTFGPDGTLLGRHRKLIPTHAEQLAAVAPSWPSCGRRFRRRFGPKRSSRHPPEGSRECVRAKLRAA